MSLFLAFARRMALLALPALATLAPAQAATGSGTDAKTCIQITRGDSYGRPFNVITNKCAQKIGINYCHEPSGMPGTRGTECGHGGRYYQQFTSLEPGQTTGNQYSSPGDAQVRFGACMGGEGKIRQTKDGEYICKP
jgi:hypothetical protein